MVVFFHALRMGRFSTFPLLGLTDGRFILLAKVNVGGFSGYSGPHTIERE